MSGRKNDKLDVNFLLNDKNLPPRASSQRTTSTAHNLPGASSSSSSRSGLEALVQRNSCRQCGHVFAQPADLKKHVLTVHDKKRPFQCEQCGKRFGEKGNMSKHIRSVHMNQRDFACSQCNAKFAFKDGLQRHVRLVHEKVRPFICQTCGASYKQISQLRHHSETCGSAGTSRR